MKCAVHPETEASGFCRDCGKAMCPACVRPVRDVLYCEDCLAKVMGLPLQQPEGTPPGAAVPVAGAVPHPDSGKAGVAFLLGLVPGLGAIYNGEYNKALVHIVIFAAIILGINLDLGEGPQALLICALCIFPFYMAIDAVRSLKARQSGTPYKDPLENWSKERSMGPALLIGLGILFLLRNFGVLEFFRFRELFFPLLLIGLGAFMLRKRIGG